MIDLVSKAVEGAVAQVPLAVVFLVAIVWIVRFALAEMGTIVDRNTIAWQATTTELKRMRRALRARRANNAQEPAPR